MAGHSTIRSRPALPALPLLAAALLFTALAAPAAAQQSLTLGACRGCSRRCNTQIDIAQTAYTSAQDIIKTLQTQLKAATADVTTLRSQAAQSAATIKMLSEQLQAATQPPPAPTPTQSTGDNCTAALADAQAASAALAGQLAAATNASTACAADLASARATIAALNATINATPPPPPVDSTCPAQLSAANASLATCYSALAAANANITQLQEQLRGIQLSNAVSANTCAGELSSCQVPFYSGSD
jgi:hypothetical protein